MQVSAGKLAFLAFSLVAAHPLERPKACTFEDRRDAVAKEIKTIGSHSLADAAAIPLAPLASRTFYITPGDLGNKLTLPPVNVGVTATTVRAELAGLATFLDAHVPPDSVHYTNNANGSVTVDFIQTNRIVLPVVDVREIHEFDLGTCQITRITGYVHGRLVCPSSINNTILQKVCKATAKVGKD